VISSSQGLYLYTNTEKRIYTQTPNIYSLSGIRTHDPGFRASEDSSCLRPLIYRDRRLVGLALLNCFHLDIFRIFSYGSTAPCWPWPTFQFLVLFTQSVGLLGRGISPSQGRYLHTEQHKQRINVDGHPCLEWASNPRPQRSSGRRHFTP
jgi:hypothetical protein